jgi:choline dehydrogenase-like flavoprotein
MAWRCPPEILEDWERILGTAEFGPTRMGELFEHVEGRIHSSFQHPVSLGDDNRIMAEGARRLGWKYEINRRNQEMCVGSNNCVFGCPTGAKQSTLVSYMPRALEHGARVLTEVKVERLLIGGGRCDGIVGHAIDPRTRRRTHGITVRAKATVVACGAVQTPTLLLGHRLGRSSGQLGRNFLCHPNAKVLAVYPFDIHGWQGVSQWVQVRHFRNEGIVMAENMIPPAAIAAHIPYVGAEAWELMRRYNQMIVSGVLVEDSTTGRVRRSPFGTSVAKYDITALDHERFIKGVKLLSELHFGMGAEFVLLPFAHIPRANSMDDVAKLTVHTAPMDSLELFTVHLMGTGRMGPARESSVTDLNGQLWDLPGCYVADASLFPTAVGVNPQITIMALATHVAHAIETKVRAGVRAAKRTRTVPAHV